MTEARKKPRRLGLRWGIGLSTTAILIVTVWLIVVYVRYGSDRATCAYLVARSADALGNRPSKGLVGMGGRYLPFEAVPWMEGYGRAQGEDIYRVDIADDNIRKSRLALWRVFMDPGRAVGAYAPAGLRLWICPARRGDGSPADFEQSDFSEPRRNLFYSMFNQSPEVPDMIPQVTKRPGFVIMGDRSPQDDGLPLSSNSANHMWFGTPTGQNVLFSSTEVKWVESTAVGIDEDEIYARGSFVNERVTKDTVPVDKNDTVLMPVAE